MDGLVDFIKQFNRSSKLSKLHIWSRTRSSPEGGPLIVRYTVRDVLTFFVNLGRKVDSILVVEGCTAFGPRERVRTDFQAYYTAFTLVQKSPHSCSDYNAFQNLSQQIARMIQSHPHVSFQTLLVSGLDLPRDRIRSGGS